MEKKNYLQKVLDAGGKIVDCEKMSLNNIVFPAWSELGLLGKIFSQTIYTKESQRGCYYAEAAYRVVMRILDGKLLINDKPDAYAWDNEFLAKQSRKIQPIGLKSIDGTLVFTDLLNTVTDIKDKRCLIEMFQLINRDLLLITTAAEKRKCIVITEEIAKNGISWCINEWDNGENGEYEHCPLAVGDVLIVNEEQKTCYKIKKDEFNMTHKLL